MKNYKLIVGVVLVGISTMSAQAKQNNRNESNRFETQRTTKVQKLDTRYAKATTRKNVRKTVAKLPQKKRRVIHRGVEYFVSKGVCYKRTRGGYSVVRTPW